MWSSAPVAPIHPRVGNWAFRIHGLAVGARYEVGVAAVNSAGTSLYAYQSVKADCGRGYTHVEGQGLCILPPHSPTGLAALPGTSTLHVSWRQGTWNNYSPVTGYKLRWRAGSTGAWTNVDVPWTSGVDWPTPGARRKDFTHTIRGLSSSVTFYEIQVASYNQIPGEHSRWVTISVSNCPAGEVRFTTSSGCLNIPALPAAAGSLSPTVTLRPGSSNGSLNAAWWQNINAFNPSSYQLQWKLHGETTWSQTYLSPTAVNIPVPSRYTARGWTLNSTELTGLDVCTHEVRIFARGTARHTWGSTIVSAAPRGTTTAPDAPQRFQVAAASENGDQLYVYWIRPRCDGGARLTNYTIAYRTTGAANWTTNTTESRAGELNKQHNGHAITGLTTGQNYEIRVTITNAATLTSSRTRTVTPMVRQDPAALSSLSSKHAWRPYRMPPDQYALVNEKIMLGQTVLVCTSAADLVVPLDEAVVAWNAALTDNRKTTPTPRSEDAPAGEFAFSGSASTPADCGENNPHSFDVAVMDYRTNCPATSSTCADTSCASPNRSTATANNCAATTGCPLSGGANGCMRFRIGDSIGGGKLLPRSVQNSSGTVHIIISTDNLLRHELGHNLYLADYGYGCHWISEDTTESSVMSYGTNHDWRDYQRIVNTQNPQATKCQSDTITQRDKEDLHTIYHPAAFASLSIGTGQSGMEHFVVGSPPQDLDGNDYYNAYRYVILHRAPQGTNPNPNAFTQLMNGSEPVVLTQEQLVNTDPQDDVGYLDSNGHFVLTSVDLAGSAFANLRRRGHEFVFVGVTRGNPQRDPSKSLNPVSAAGLAHAVMTLDLGPNTGLAGVHKWTLGTPVLYIRP